MQPPQYPIYPGVIMPQGDQTGAIISSLSDQFLMQILISSFILLGLQIACLWFIRGWDLPPIWKLEGQPQETINKKIFQFVVMVSFVPAMYLPTITSMYYLGLFK